ncbi:MAG: radical SAM protein [Elusimicrobiota bacterium]
MNDHRAHVLTSLRCNNHCVFCMEGDHLAASDPSGLAPFMSEGKLRRQLLQIKDRDLPVLFTGGEPTLNPRLPQLIGLARRLGFERIGLQTNGRRILYPDYLRRLVDAGLSDMTISIHGSVGRIHDAMTRLPGSLAQTLSGLAETLRCKILVPRLRLATTTTICRINLKDMEGLLKLLLGRSGIDAIVLNPLILSGNAARYRGQLTASYAAMVRHFRASLDRLGREGARGFDRITWTDMPPCVMPGLEDYVGTFERVTVFPPETGRMEVLPEKLIFPGIKRARCRSCSRRRACTGINPAYIRSFGWSEFVPCR